MTSKRFTTVSYTHLDVYKRQGQGWDILINDGYELTDVEKIIPSAVPESDLALAQQMADLVFQTAGINLENWSAPVSYTHL